jgi:hypothetical protein
MSDELFQVEPVLSPRLKWMQTYGVKTHYAHHMVDELPWSAWTASNASIDGDGMPKDPEMAGYGDSETEALLDLMANNNLPHWNQ